MSEKKKAVELNFGIVLIILIILFGIVFVVARTTGGKILEEIQNGDEEEIKVNEEESKEYKPYSKDVITIDEGKITANWEIIDKSYGSIVFWVQGPKNENEDGTYNDIRVNFYIQKSQMTNDELKTQMLEDSIYQKIEYTKMQEINDIQWMEFEAENKGVKAKILTKMQDGYMYAAEINGEENLYNEYYNEAMKIVMTLKISERIPQEKAEEAIYEYDNLANIKEGGTKYLLTSLNLPKTIETEENLPEEYQEYTWTGISYQEFENSMKKYMTEDVLRERFSEFINYKDTLLVKETTGEQADYMIDEVTVIEIKGNETTYKVTKQNMVNYITTTENITLKYENGKAIVSKAE